MKRTSAKLLMAICIYFGFFFNLSGQVIQYDQATSTFTVLSSPPLPILGLRKGQKPAWEYLWIMGRTHWIITKSNQLKYCFQAGEEPHVYVRLTPIYSTSRTRRVQMTFLVNQLNYDCESIRSPVLGATDYLTVNASNDNIIAESEAELAINYRLPNNVSSQTNGGIIVAIYNKKEDSEKLRFPPFKNSPQMLQSLERNARKIPLHSVDWFRLKKGVKDQIHSLRALYDGIAFFEVGRLEKRKEYSLFLTFTPSASFDHEIIPRKRNEKEFTTDVQILWIPYNYEFIKPKMQMAQVFNLEYVIDPNKLKIVDPKGPAHYLGERSELTYKLLFENKGQGIAKHVEAEISFSDSKNLDPYSVVPLENSLDCSTCPEDYTIDDLRYQDRTCLFVDKSQIETENKVTFHFRNIHLIGKKEKGAIRRFTKGSLLFKINGSKKKEDRHGLYATIRFKGGGGDSLQTKVVNKRWRHRDVGSNIGSRFFQDLRAGDIPTGVKGSSWLQSLNTQLYYNNTPLLNGWGYRGTLRYADFRNNEFLEASRIFHTSRAFLGIEQTQLDISNLDIVGQLNYRIKGIVEVGVGGGVSVPLMAQRRTIRHGFDFSFLERNDFSDLISGSTLVDDGTISNLYLASLREQLISSYVPENRSFVELASPNYVDEITLANLPSANGFWSSTSSSFGMLNSNRGDEQISRFGVGWNVNWSIEFGLLNDISFGLRHEVRFYPRIYRSSIKTNTADNFYPGPIDLLDKWERLQLSNFTFTLRVRLYRF